MVFVIKFQIVHIFLVVIVISCVICMYIFVYQAVTFFFHI
jgi:hypothetical protein